MLDTQMTNHLAHRYGADARVIIALIEQRPDLAEPLVDGLPYLRAEAVFGVRYEQAVSVDDGWRGDLAKRRSFEFWQG